MLNGCDAPRGVSARSLKRYHRMSLQNRKLIHRQGRQPGCTLEVRTFDMKWFVGHNYKFIQINRSYK